MHYSGCKSGELLGLTTPLPDFCCWFGLPHLALVIRVGGQCRSLIFPELPLNRYVCLLRPFAYTQTISHLLRLSSALQCRERYCSDHHPGQLLCHGHVKASCGRRLNAHLHDMSSYGYRVSIRLQGVYSAPDESSRWRRYLLI